MQRKVYLHVGAHRTGTSSFQLCLALNRARLAEEGYDLAYPGRDGAPGGTLRLRLPRPRMGAEHLPEYVRKTQRALEAHLSAQRQKLILSEENLPGLIVHYFKGRLYPNRRRRLQAFRGGLEAVGAEVAHLVLVIRPYAALFVSGYRKHAEDNPVPPFSDYAQRMADFAGGWPQTVQALQNVLRPARLTVVDYGARGQSRALLAELVGGSAARFEEPARALNTSATDAALEHLQQLYHGGQRLERPAWQEVIARYAEARSPRGFAAFEAAQSARLEARYAADLQALAQMDGVRLLCAQPKPQAGQAGQ
ncbi:hypothetical protein [uncultured Lentibacter sp.]|uniref:hypothetical protein n=1 Tax=uncultured Lentibacter sp. TaxID=1659309 RepID=UPI00261D609F|nr:hypothetical protein [uncultured Lentibacter sp.]